mmetsp:Transcript_6096/g.12751  ORF Transcript_6096/g.12751 Transcript_6096/m.12751 type:complete len:103 (-) Transcript_6096:1524-1832(-)
MNLLKFEFSFWLPSFHSVIYQMYSFPKGVFVLLMPKWTALHSLFVNACLANPSLVHGLPSQPQHSLPEYTQPIAPSFMPSNSLSLTPIVFLKAATEFSMYPA